MTMFLMLQIALAACPDSRQFPGWTTVCADESNTPEGLEPACFNPDSEPYRLYWKAPVEADPSTATKVMVYLQATNDAGGVECSNSYECVRKGLASGFSGPTSDQGVFSDEPDNPFADYLRVFVPYCSRDRHIGHAELTITEDAASLGQGTPETYRFRGADNVAWVMSALTSELDADAVESAVLLGGSAGGGGALYNSPHLKRTFPNADAVVVANAGLDPANIRVEAAPDMLGWNMRSTMERLDVDLPTGLCGQEGTNELYYPQVFCVADVWSAILSSPYAPDRMGYVGSANDPVQPQHFTALGVGDEAASCYFKNAETDTLGRVTKAHRDGGFGFLVYSERHHTVLGSKNVFEVDARLESKQLVTVAEWLGSMIDPSADPGSLRAACPTCLDPEPCVQMPQ